MLGIADKYILGVHDGLLDGPILGNTELFEGIKDGIIDGSKDGVIELVGHILRMDGFGDGKEEGFEGFGDGDTDGFEGL